MKLLILLTTLFSGLFFTGCGSNSSVKPKAQIVKNGVEKRNLGGGTYRLIPRVNGKVNGIVRTYDKKGILVAETPYSNGKKQGPYKQWSMKNGKRYLSKEGTYINGKEEGLSRHYNSQGRITILAGHKKDNLDGIWKEWGDKGQGHDVLLQDGHHIRGVQSGNWVWRNVNTGKIEGTASFTTSIDKKGNHHRTSVEKEYNEKGQLNNTVSRVDANPAVMTITARQKRETAAQERKERAQKKKTVRNVKTSSRGKTRITRNDGKFIGGVCSDESTFFIEVKGPLYEGSGTNGVCTKADLSSTISCVCSGG